MKKGFTLIELLAVIVILAIIALIAIPTILNIIGDVNKKSAEISMDNLDHAVELYYQTEQMKESFTETMFVCKDGECTNGRHKLEIDGKNIKTGIITIDASGKINYDSILINNYSCNIENNNVVCNAANEKEFKSESNRIVLTDSTSRTLVNYRIYGTSSGVGDFDGDTNSYAVPITLSGKNLIPPCTLTPPEDEINGITFTANDDGTITAKGKAEADVTFRCHDYSSIDYPADVYVYKSLTDEYRNAENNKSYVISQLFLKNQNKQDITDLSEYYAQHPVKETIPENAKYIVLILTVRAGATVENYVFKPQLELGTTATDYEPYVEPKQYVINLSSPLMENDYIDFESQSVVRSNGTIEKISLPIITTLGVSTTIVEVATTNAPSSLEVAYIK